MFTFTIPQLEFTGTEAKTLCSVTSWVRTYHGRPKHRIMFWTGDVCSRPLTKMKLNRDILQRSSNHPIYVWKPFEIYLKSFSSFYKSPQYTVIFLDRHINLLALNIHKRYDSQIKILLSRCDFLNLIFQSRLWRKWIK